MKWLKNIFNVKVNYIVSFWISLIFSIGLMIGGYFAPPKGVIDGSILTACGIVFLYPSLAFGAKALEENKSAKITKGDTTITIGEK